jgi:WXG100 family type VII secretion target
VTSVVFSPEVLAALIRQMDDSRKAILSSADALERAVIASESGWQGDARQAFLRFYIEWRKGVNRLAQSMKQSSEQLGRMADAREQHEGKIQIP